MGEGGDELKDVKVAGGKTEWPNLAKFNFFGYWLSTGGKMLNTTTYIKPFKCEKT